TKANFELRVSNFVTYQNLENPSKTPNPKSAKSYFTGSSASNFFRLEFNSEAAFQSFCFLFSKPNFRATFPEWTSSGQTSWEDDMFFQIPKSTPWLSLRVIHLKNMFNRFAAEFFAGLDNCFSERSSCGTSKNKCLNRSIACTLSVSSFLNWNAVYNPP